jgi:hypothetical protein
MGESTMVEVEHSERLADRVRISCLFDRSPSEPVAPGGLYHAANDEAESFLLHRVAARDGTAISFETFDAADRPLPPAGTRCFYRAWWTPDAMAAALDRETTWCLRRYPSYAGTHAHCLFTWTTLSTEPGHVNHGYWSSRHGWVVERAWRDYIRGDVYRLRADDPELLRREAEFLRVWRILMQQWDPIGVTGVPEAADEYDNYVRHVAGLLREGASAEAVTAYLWGIETQHMCLRGDWPRLVKVVRQLRAPD